MSMQPLDSSRRTPLQETQESPPKLVLGRPLRAPSDWNGAHQISSLFSPEETRSLREALYTLTTALPNDAEIQHCIASVPLKPVQTELEIHTPNGSWNPKFQSCFLNRTHVLAYFNLLSTLAHEYVHAYNDPNPPSSPEEWIQSEIRAYTQAGRRIETIGEFVQVHTDIDASHRGVYRDLFEHLQAHQLHGKCDFEFRQVALRGYHHWANSLRGSSAWSQLDQACCNAIDTLHHHNVVLGSADFLGPDRLDDLSKWLASVVELAQRFNLSSLRAFQGPWEKSFNAYVQAEQRLHAFQAAVAQFQGNT